MLNGTKKLFPNDYDKLCKEVIDMAERDELPVTLSLKEDNGFTLKDFKDLLYDLRHDTGLRTTVSFFLCDICDKLHTLIEIDQPEIINNGIVQ